MDDNTNTTPEGATPEEKKEEGTPTEGGEAPASSGTTEGEAAA